MIFFSDNDYCMNNSYNDHKMSDYKHILDVSDYDDRPTRKRNMYKICDIILKIFIALILTILVIFLIIFISELGSNINAMVINTDNLITGKFSKELDHMHDMISNINDLITFINSNYATQNVTDQVLTIISNMNNITVQTNITELQTDMHSIACSLQKITGDPNPC